MALELRQQLKLTQQLVMTPQLQMAIKLLQLSRLELLDQIHQELEENPALEEVPETQQEEQNTEQLSKTDVENTDNKEVTIDEKLPEDIDWSNYIDEYNSVGRASFETESRDGPRYEAFISKKESLNDHLIWQLAMSFPAEYEQELGSLIIGNLNKDGYLDAPLEDLAAISGASPEQVQDALELIQSFDPVGVAARDLGAHISHVKAVTQGYVFSTERTGTFENRHAFAGEHGFVDT